MEKTRNDNENIIEINSVNLHDETAIIHMSVEAWKTITDSLSSTFKFNMQNKTYTQVRDRMFRSLFKEKKELLSLYNAIRNTNYESYDDLEIVTLEGAIYLGMKNDVSFIISSNLFLYEHQSTDNPNMPLRDLFYIAEQYHVLTVDKNIYATRQIGLPTPHFVVLYNGDKDAPDRFEYRLSDAYLSKEDSYDLDLRVSVININQGHNQNVLARCKTLEEFSKFTEILRNYRSTLNTNQAISATIDYCIHNNILADYLLRNKAEVENMVLYDFDLDKYKRDLAEEVRLDLADEIQQLADEKQQLVDEKQQLVDEKQQLVDEKQQLADEKQQLADEKQQLADEKQQLADEKQQLADENKKLLAQIEELQAKLN